MTADEYFDGLIARVAQGRAREPHGLTPDEFCDGALRRLADPARRGIELTWLWKELDRSHPIDAWARIAAVVRNDDVPRVVRARHANLLAAMDNERWFELVEELDDGDDLLGFEGFAEFELSLQHAGLPRDIADALEDVPEDYLPDAPLIIERVRRHVGMRAAAVWGSVVARPALKPFWLVACAALADEGSPEALAALDLALLGTKGAEARILEEARRRLVAAHPTFVRPGPAGEAYVNHSLVDGQLWGLLALGSDGVRMNYFFEKAPGRALKVKKINRLPAELSLGAGPILAKEEGGLEVPLGELLGLLARVAEDGVESEDPAVAGSMKGLLSQVPRSPPLAAGEPFSDAELAEQCASGVFSTWLIPHEELRTLALALKATLDGSQEEAVKLVPLSLRVEFAARFLAWKGEADLAARVAAHAVRERQEADDFLRFAIVWVTTRLDAERTDAA